jgi:hypothetical protein
MDGTNKRDYASTQQLSLFAIQEIQEENKSDKKVRKILVK